MEGEINATKITKKKCLKTRKSKRSDRNGCDDRNDRIDKELENVCGNINVRFYV